MNNSYITIIKEKRTDWSRKHVPLNQNECTADFRIGVPFKQNLHKKIEEIAETLKMNPQTVKTRLRRGRETLKRILLEEGYDASEV